MPKTINVELNDEADQALEEFRLRAGMTKKAALSRLMLWFARQDQTLQSIILGQVKPEDVPGVLKLLLKRARQSQDDLEGGARGDDRRVGGAC